MPAINKILAFLALGGCMLATASAAEPPAQEPPVDTSSGCWVRLFNVENFQGNESKTIVGPVTLQTLKFPTGRDWSRKAESLIVGPNATVTVYENESFRDRTMRFDADARASSLRKDLGFLHSISSLKLTCNRKP